MQHRICGTVPCPECGDPIVLAESNYRRFQRFLGQHGLCSCGYTITENFDLYGTMYRYQERCQLIAEARRRFMEIGPPAWAQDFLGVSSRANDLINLIWGNKVFGYVPSLSQFACDFRNAGIHEGGARSWMYTVGSDPYKGGYKLLDEEGVVLPLGILPGCHDAFTAMGCGSLFSATEYSITKTKHLKTWFNPSAKGKPIVIKLCLENIHTILTSLMKFPDRPIMVTPVMEPELLN